MESRQDPLLCDWKHHSYSEVERIVFLLTNDSASCWWPRQRQSHHFCSSLWHVRKQAIPIASNTWAYIKMSHSPTCDWNYCIKIHSVRTSSCPPIIINVIHWKWLGYRLTVYFAWLHSCTYFKNYIYIYEYIWMSIKSNLNHCHIAIWYLSRNKPFAKLNVVETLS